jgi:hypothetical protein
MVADGAVREPEAVCDLSRDDPGFPKLLNFEALSVASGSSGRRTRVVADAGGSLLRTPQRLPKSSELLARRLRTRS